MILLSTCQWEKHRYDMTAGISISISYSGRSADNNALDLYDAGQALVGFHRSLALTAHLVLNNQIITQATALKGAQILSMPPQSGSWTSTAVIVIGGLWAISSVTKDSPIGNLIS